MENKSNGLGIASMVIGIIALLLSCCYGGVLGIVGLILGIVGLTKPGKKGTAIAGVVTSSISILVLLGFILMYGSASGVSVLNDYIEKSEDAQTSSSLNNTTEDVNSYNNDLDTEDTQAANLPSDDTEDVANDDTEAPAEVNGPEITLDEFNQIQTGMSYQEVVAIIGSEGELQSESEVAGITTKMYYWSGKGIVSSASFMFQNDSLISKSQIGLE